MWQVGTVTAAQTATFPTSTEPKLLGIKRCPNSQGQTPLPSAGPSWQLEDLCSCLQPPRVPSQTSPFVLMPASSLSLNDPSPSLVFTRRVYL